MPFYDYIRIRGIQGDYPTAEAVQGIGSNSDGAAGSPENPISIDATFTQTEAELDPAWLTCLDTWQSDFGAWIEACEAQIEAQEEAFAAGEVYEEQEFPEIPTLNLPVPLPPGTPPAIIVVIRLIEMALVLWEMPLVRAIVRQLFRRIKSGGNTDPALSLFKYFGFVWDGKTSGTPPPVSPKVMTSIHLLNADKPIEIIDSMGNRDVFLDTDTFPD